MILNSLRKNNGTYRQMAAYTHLSFPTLIKYCKHLKANKMANIEISQYTKHFTITKAGLAYLEMHEGRICPR